ncbi:MAG: peptidylprolyl isomerase [Nitrospiraceae bacterium]|nr:MAG: peptidylprolyl isomerase [Nitrospiraceae bacterium]
MKKLLLFSFSLALALAFVSGCEQKAKSNSPMLAKVGKTEITRDEFLKEITRIPEWARGQFSGEEGKERFLEELVRRELIYQDAKKMKLDKDPEYIEKMKEFERMTLVSLILKKEVEEKAKVDEAEVKDFYDKNADKFTIGTKVRASHILIDTEDQAKKISDRIKKGENFSKLAESLSNDKGSASKGGDLGFFGRGQMVPEFEQAVLSLKPGEVSEPVKTRFGYHIIKLTDIQKGEVATFEQSREAIKRQLLAEKQKQLVDSYIEGLNKKAEINKSETELKSITLPWEAGEAK